MEPKTFTSGSWQEMTALLVPGRMPTRGGLRFTLLTGPACWKGGMLLTLARLASWRGTDRHVAVRHKKEPGTSSFHKNTQASHFTALLFYDSPPHIPS